MGDVFLVYMGEQSQRVRVLGLGTVSCCREACFSTAGTRKFAGIFKKQGPKIFREMEIVPGCAVRVACPSCPDYSQPPGPGRMIRNMLGWSLLEETARSGVWVFRGALQGEKLFSLLDAAGDWESAQRGRSPVIPHVLVHMRMDMAPLSGRTLESGAGHC